MGDSSHGEPAPQAAKTPLQPVLISAASTGKGKGSKQATLSRGVDPIDAVQRQQRQQRSAMPLEALEVLCRRSAFAAQVLFCLFTHTPDKLLIGSSGLFFAPAGAVTQEGMRLIAHVRHLYEALTPFLVRALRRHRQGGQSSQEGQGGQGGTTGTTAAMIDQAVKLLAVTSQRLLKVFEKIVLLSRGVLSGDGSADFAGGDGNGDEADADADAIVMWEELLSLLVEPIQGYDTVLAFHDNDLVRGGRGSKATGRHGAKGARAGGAADEEEHVGALVADALKVFGPLMQSFVDLVTADRGRAEYLLKALAAPKGLLSPRPRGASSSRPRPMAFSASSRGQEPGARGGARSNDDDKDKIGHIQSIFPDFGDAFIRACLKVFDGSVQRTLDALLEDNLPPQLMAMDRSLKAAWVGKGGPDAAAVVGTVGRSKETVYQLQVDEEFRRQEKERIRAQQREEEVNFSILAREYDDDYDDQYDDAIAPSKLAMPSDADDDTTTSMSDTRTGKKPRGGKSKTSDGPVINWEVKMSEMKRLNSMIRAEEKEQEFWKAMRNTNHDAPRGGYQQEDGDGDDDGNDGGNGNGNGNSSARAGTGAGPGPGPGPGAGRQAPGGGGAGAGGRERKGSGQRQPPGQPKAQEQGTGPGQGGRPTQTQQVNAGRGRDGRAGGGRGGRSGAGSVDGKSTGTDGGEGGGETTRAPKTKTFDRHHQRDKAMRKTGGFL